MKSLDKIKLSVSSFSDEIIMYRHGKDANLALEKRSAEADVFNVLVAHMLYDAPNGSVKRFSIGKRKYRVVLEPVSDEKETDNVNNT